ncbi:MAG: ATP-binding protein [Thermosynechococcaceae cyanobacterium MS004]|nr:ATP-binding protein [Thermosynechococcaceae cyanobacterium MS004]
MFFFPHFRGPHHSASGPALVGGGSFPRPGEISLGYHGIFITEFIHCAEYFGAIAHPCLCWLVFGALHF